MSEGIGDTSSNILNYASSDADGLPTCVPEAEEMIDRGSSPKQIRHLFRKTEEAVRYFAKSMSRRYDVAHLEKSCVNCAAQNPRFVAQVIWLATAKFRPFEFRMRGKAFTLAKTFHPLCYPCAKDYHHRMYRFIYIRHYLPRYQRYIYLGFIFTAATVGFLLTWFNHWIVFLPELLLSIYFFVGIGGWIIKLKWRRQLPAFLLKQQRPGWKVAYAGTLFIREGDVLRDSSLKSK
jgi:hypothetical protein